MKKMFTLFVALLSLWPAIAAEAQDEAPDNYLSIEVLPTTDVTRIPVQISMTNQLDITAVEFYLSLSNGKNLFVYDEDEEDYLYEKSSRFKRSHTVTMDWNTNEHPGVFFVSIVSSKSQFFDGNSGPLITLYIDGSSITDGKYDVKMESPMLIWSDQKSSQSYVSPDEDEPFQIEDEKVYPGDVVQSCMITFTLDGQELKTEKYPLGVAVTAPAIEPKTGYTFSGWGELKTTSADTTYAATFDINKYVVTYMVDSLEFQVDTLNYGATITPPEVPAKEGHTFSGWGDITETVSADTTFYGAYTPNKYTVVFIAQGDTLKTMVLDYGTIIQTTDTPYPPETDYTLFDGWELEPVTKDTTYVAQYHKEYISVLYMLNGEEYKSFQYCPDDGELVHPDVAVEDWQIFSGWKPGDSSTNTYWSYVATVINKSYPVSFVIDDIVFKADTLEYGTELSAPEAPAKEGHTFSGWGEVAKTVTDTLVYKGTYAVNQYTVSFVLDGDTLASGKLDYGSAITAPEVADKEGYTFSGWGEVAQTVPAKDVEYKATYTVNQYIVSFVLDGDTLASGKLDYGATITAPEVAAKEGYTFSGWGEVAQTVPAKDVEYKATYTVNQYTVSFVLDGDTLASGKLDYGATITPPEVADKEGYTFSGWGEVAQTVPAKDVVYQASFVVNRYQVSYIVNGEVYASDSLAYGTELVLPAQPEVKGYNFRIWKGVADTMPAGDLTIIAVLSRLGDVNLDDKLNSADVVSIYNYIISADESGVLRSDADVNKDNIVNAADVVGVYNIITYGVR